MGFLKYFSAVEFFLLMWDIFLTGSGSVESVMEGIGVLDAIVTVSGASKRPLSGSSIFGKSSKSDLASMLIIDN